MFFLVFIGRYFKNKFRKKGFGWGELGIGDVCDCVCCVCVIEYVSVCVRDCVYVNDCVWLCVSDCDRVCEIECLCR